MPIVLADASKPTLIDLERTYLNGRFYALYKNNLTPIDANVLADFTEVTDTGYVATGRQSPVFAAATLNAANEGELLAPALTWVLDHDSGDYTIYGYFVSTAASGGVLLYSERAATPFVVTGPGQTYSVTPRKVMDTQ